MAIQYVNSGYKVIAMINLNIEDKPCGKREIYYLPGNLNVETVRELSEKLCHYRARFLPQNALIDTCIAKKMGQLRRTTNVLTRPLESKYPPPGRDKFEHDTLTIPPAADPQPNQPNELVSIKLNQPFETNDPDCVSTFRLETDSLLHSIHQFQGIPDPWVDELTAVHAVEDNAAIEYYTPNGLANDPQLIPAHANYWKNYKDFFDFLFRHFVFLGKNDGTNPAQPIGDFPYMIDSLKRVMFRGISTRKPGKALREYRGRRAISL
jgi:hypothetical protein